MPRCYFCREEIAVGKACSAGHAFQFAVEELMNHRSAKALNYDPDKRGQTGLFGEFRYLDAIMVYVRAEACDPGDDRKPSWFLAWWMPDPLQEKPEFTDYEKRKLMRSIANFQCLLCEEDFIGECKAAGKKGCKKKLTGKREAVR